MCSGARPGNVQLGRPRRLQCVFVAVRQQREARDKCMQLVWSDVHDPSDHGDVAAVLDGCTADGGGGSYGTVVSHTERQ